MKKMFFALVALVVVASCSETPQDKMEKVIKAAMEKEYPSYEALKFAENVDTVYTKLEDMTAPWQKLLMIATEKVNCAMPQETTKVHSSGSTA